MRLKPENLYLICLAFLVGTYASLVTYYPKGIFFAIGINICNGRAVSDFCGRSMWPIYAMEYFYLLNFSLIFCTIYVWLKYKKRDHRFICLVIIFMIFLGVFASYFMPPKEKTPVRLGQIFYGFSFFIMILYWKMFRDWSSGDAKK